MHNLVIKDALPDSEVTKGQGPGPRVSSYKVDFVGWTYWMRNNIVDLFSDKLLRNNGHVLVPVSDHESQMDPPI